MKLTEVERALIKSDYSRNAGRIQCDTIQLNGNC